MSSRNAWPLALVVLAACDYHWVLDVDVTVPVATQAALAAYPQQVMVRYRPRDGTSSSVYRVGVLCAAGTAPFAAHAHLESLGPKCSPVYEVEGWLTPSDPAADLPCGAWYKAEDLFPCDGPACAPQPGEPAGATVAFDGGCRREDSVSLVVEPAPMVTTQRPSAAGDSQ